MLTWKCASGRTEGDGDGMMNKTRSFGIPPAHSGRENVEKRPWCRLRMKSKVRPKLAYDEAYHCIYTCTPGSIPES